MVTATLGQANSSRMGEHNTNHTAAEQFIA
ncbi:hypothetical protein os4_16160 [Comamonadaceae bacterium OS-4]|nr:hypothetical protein os4_16160 [Comamonadaceae bacterium OS-4]